ncbi:NAD(P)/FAD-dependent oxidoreductase [Onishia niordana]|uniref:NAD(P)/FAD-dependent oxidoreductase n=1 Tax=Onishia niordana TaxID=2508711 RepID=UPI00109FF53F|nr:FAD-binding oxidoreductase [Halomonas niordiana]
MSKESDVSDTIVLGAGMVGVSIAYHLAKRGRSVVLVDRREPGHETSFGNAGIIQREAVAPYPFPRDAKTLMQVVPNRRVDIRYRPTGMLESASALFHYWQNSAPAPYARILPEYASLIGLSTQEHAPMIAAAGADALVSRDGWLELYRTHEAFESRLAKVEPLAKRFGLTYERLDRAALVEQEPDLSQDAIGAILWRDSWTVADPGGLVAAYAEAFKALGGRVIKASVESVEQSAEGWQVETDAGSLEAAELVMAMGPWSGDWLSRLGYRLPLFVKRGYHMHYALKEGHTLKHWVMDAEVGYLLAPMRAGVRLTTGAELANRDAPPDLDQLGAAEAVARQLVPLGERRDETPWKGARPCTSDMKPVIGPAPSHKGLWFAFGHGHQGFTLGPATGRLLGEMMDGESPAIDMAPFRADRF